MKRKRTDIKRETDDECEQFYPIQSQFASVNNTFFLSSMVIALFWLFARPGVTIDEKEMKMASK